MLISYWGSSALLNRSLYAIAENNPTGTPKIAWVAMGLQTGEMGNGWYNFYNRDIYWNNDCDIETAKTLSWKSIEMSVDYFIHDPVEMRRFFKYKLISQWTNPTFEAFRLMQNSLMNNPNEQYDYPDRVKEFLYYSNRVSLDTRHPLINGYMKVYCLVIAVGALFYLIFHRINSDNCILFIIFIGGFLFQTIWEASCRYVAPYFIILIPYSVEGIRSFMDHLPPLNIFKSGKGNE